MGTTTAGRLYVCFCLSPRIHKRMSPPPRWLSVASLAALASLTSFLSTAAAAEVAVVLRPCVFDGAGLASPPQRYAYNVSSSAFELQDGSGRCLSLASPCAGNDGDVAVLAPCAPGGGACQTWSASGASGNPPNAFSTPSSGRCLEVNGAHNANLLDVWDCATPPSQWKNMEWSFNATSGAIASLDTDPALTNLCITPGPSPAPNLKIGTYDFFVDESSPVIFNGALLMFESIVQNSPQWAGHWIPAFANCQSYYRVRDMHTLAVIVNITSTCNHAFGAATVFQDASGADTLLVSGTPWARAGSERRAGAEAWSGPCQNANNCTVDLFWTSDPTLVDSSWSFHVPGIRTPAIGVYNNDILAVPAAAGSTYKWAMALETTGENARFAVSGDADPTNTSAWLLLNSTYTVPSLPDVGSCPSLRHDGTYFYYLTGGSNIQILRSPDLLSWNESQKHVFLHEDAGDCVIAPTWFGAPTGYVPSAAAEALISACGISGNYGDDSDVDLVEWPTPFGVAGGPPVVVLQYGSGNQATFGFSNLGLYNGSMVSFLQSYFE